MFAGPIRGLHMNCAGIQIQLSLLSDSGSVVTLLAFSYGLVLTVSSRMSWHHRFPVRVDEKTYYVQFRLGRCSRKPLAIQVPRCHLLVDSDYSLGRKEGVVLSAC